MKLNTEIKNKKEARIRIPDAPEQVPDYIRLMQYELYKSYGLAQRENSPRFLEKDHNPLPNTINREILEGEQRINILSAWSNSVFSVKVLFFLKSYQAKNAIQDLGSYWCSTGQHDEDEEIIYEVTFHKTERVHGMNLIFAYAPGKYKVEYSIDEINYNTIVNWHNTVDEVNRKWWERLIPSLKQSFKSFPDRITFDHPVFAKKMRILMKQPVNYYYGLYKIEFFTKEWVIMIKVAENKNCLPEQCWSINEIQAKAGDKIKITDCVKTLALAENRELFKFTIDGLLQHYETGLCVTTAQDKELTLMDCLEAKEKNDGREKFIFEADGSIVSEYNQDECISAKSGIHNIALDGVAEASSVSSDGNHEAYRAIDSNANTFWASVPGNENVTFTLSFNKWITADKLLIDWKYPAKEYDIYAMTYEKGWKHIVKVYNNYKKSQKISLNVINIRSIEIKMKKASESLFNLPVYGIISITINDGGVALSRNSCTALSVQEKSYTCVEQYFYLTNQKLDYRKEMNNLAKYFLKFRGIKEMLFKNWSSIKQAKNYSKYIKKLVDESSVSLKAVFNRLKVFKSKDIINKSTKYIDTIKKYKLVSYFGNSKVNKSNTLGSFMTNPAEDCHQIKKLNKFKKSGFYWIKPDCSKSAIKVFCDFSIEKGGVSIYIYNNDQLPSSNLETLSINNFKDIRYYCANKGLYPIEIKNKDYVSRIFYLLKFLGWDTSLPYVIPIGHDYDCEKGTCANQYKSLNKKDTKNIMSYFKENDKDLAIFNSLSKKDSVGFGYSTDEKPYFFNLNEANYTALICSTNDNGAVDSDPSVTILSCKDNLVNKNLNAQIGKTIKVKCPEICHLDNSKVYGENRYSMNSSICRGGIHSGVINQIFGGEFEIKITSSLNKFVGSLKYDIKSEDIVMESSKTFIPLKLYKKCPIDYLTAYLNNKKKSSSFLETELTSLMKSNSKLLSEQELFDLLSNKKPIIHQNNEFFRLLQIRDKQANNNTNNSLNNNTNSANSTINNNSNSSNHSSQLNNNLANETKNTNNNLTNITKIHEIEEPISIPCNNINTDKAIIKIEEIRNIDTADLKALQIFGENTDKLTKKFIKDLSWSHEGSDLSSHSMSPKIKQMMIFFSKMQIFQKKISRKASSRLQITKNNHQSLYEMFFKLDRTTEYKINYKKIDEYWTVFNNKNSKNYPSNWSIVDSNLQGRKKGILQSSNIKSNNNRIATSFYLKNKDLFDFIFNLDIYTLSDKPAGIIFRMNDPYNFYGVEFNQKKGYKKLFRSVDGVYTQLGYLKDGGLSQNQWYKVQIIATKEKIVVKMGSDANYDLYSSLPVIFATEDNSLKSGSFGVFTNGNNKFYFDNFHIIPKPCWSSWKPNKKVKVIPERSNLYEENYKQEIENKYNIINPQNQARGPSEWVFKKNKFGQDKIIYQKTQIIDKSPFREQALLILKKKFLKKGIFSLDLMGIKKGSLGIIFRYVNKDNYYIFETGGNKGKGYFQIRKKVQGIISTIQRISPEQINSNGLNDYVYSEEKWLRAKIIANDYNFKIFISKPGYYEKLIFEFEGKDFKYGKVGFSSFGTPAAFCNISLKPKVDDISVSLLAKDLENVDTENDVFAYKITKKNTNIKKIKSSINNRINTFKKCLKNKTNDERNRYCKETYYNNLIMRVSCERNYCNSCCEKTVSITDKLSLHHCKKMCGAIKIKYDNKEEKEMSDRLCIEPRNPDQSLYNHCDNSFKNLIKRQNCKIDACRVCCISIDPIYHANQSEDNLNNCWKKCTKKFNIFDSMFK